MLVLVYLTVTSLLADFFRVHWNMKWLSLRELFLTWWVKFFHIIDKEIFYSRAFTVANVFPCLSVHEHTKYMHSFITVA